MHALGIKFSLLPCGKYTKSSQRKLHPKGAISNRKILIYLLYLFNVFKAFPPRDLFGPVVCSEQMENRLRLIYDKMENLRFLLPTVRSLLLRLLYILFKDGFNTNQ